MCGHISNLHFSIEATENKDGLCANVPEAAESTSLHQRSNSALVDGPPSKLNRALEKRDRGTDPDLCIYRYIERLIDRWRNV